MFGTIADRYDVTNTVLSFGQHFLWRRALKGMIEPLPADPSLLDLATGTGDLIQILGQFGGQICGVDFCFPMLEQGVQKFRRGAGRPEVTFLQGDALALPFRSEQFDLVTVAFGVRNFEKLQVGLREIRRVLKRGGQLLVLEFGQPRVPVWGSLFRGYSKFVMPYVGGALTGNREAYEYLPETSRNFPCGEAFEEVLQECGFAPSRSRSLSGGVAYIYSANRAET